MKIVFRMIICILVVALFICSTGCTNNAETDVSPFFVSYQEIPGVTEQEIEAIEALKKRQVVFVYGMESSAECFYQEDGSIGGFAALFCNWMSQLFGIPFKPTIFDWNELLSGLKGHRIDFSGDLSITPERMNIYHMTGPIATRSVKVMWLADGVSPGKPSSIRPPRYIFIKGAVTYDQVAPYLEKPFKVSFVNTHYEVYQALKNGKADFFFEESPYEAAFDIYGNIMTEEFYPLIYSSVSLTTQNLELTPIISVVQKALDNGANRHLTDLYNQSYQYYLKYKFISKLSDEEQAYIKAHNESGESIPIGVEYDNYPISFYNTQLRAWQGSALDVLSAIEKLTGLRFTIAHSNFADFSDLLGMMENKEIALLSEVIPTPERQGRFLWPEPYATDNYALISLIDFKDIEANEILYLRVGLEKDTAHTELFRQWFPNHSNTVEYNDTITGLDGLERNEIDVLMGSKRLLLSATNYLEKPRYKVNIVFNRTYESAFGINVNQPHLHSIIAKAQRFVDTKTINDRWTTRMFDYRSAAARARTPYLAGASVLLLCVVALLVVMFTKGRRMNMRLEAAVEATEKANRAKSEFLATISHEIRTPMNAILGITQIELQKDNLPNENMTALEKIYNSGNNLLGIINDILDMSKIESGKLELNPDEYDVPNMINDAVQSNIVRIGAKQIEFILNIDENMPAKLYGDELRLKQILNNLLSNAIKYTEKGHVKFSINHLAHEGDIMLRFIVEDTGQGMKPEDKSRLFSEYTRFNVNVNRATEGTGLGLNIAKKLVEMMGGSIKVESEYGRGSIFTVEVKQKAVECEVIGAELAHQLRNFSFTVGKQQAKLQINYEYMPYANVLIVDDVDTNLYVATGLMKPYGLKIETVISGYEALEKIKNGNVYDIIFMDHMMPGMDGIETTKRLRDAGYTQTIVALTANALVGQADLFLGNGFDDFISKPIDVVQLDDVMNKWIRDKQSPETLRQAEAEKMNNEKLLINNRELNSHSPLPDIPGVNMQQGIVMTGGTTDGYRAVLSLFCKDAENRLPLLQQNRMQRTQFVTQVHAMKSAAASIGAEEVSQKAAELEAAGNAGDFAFIKANLGGFVESLTELVKNIRTVVALRATPLHATPLQVSLLSELAEALKLQKASDIDRLLEELMQKAMDTKTKEILEQISDNVLMAEFDSAVKIIDELVIALSKE